MPGGEADPVYDDTYRPVARRALVRCRRIFLALPEVTERLSHGAPTWFIAGKKTFSSFHDDTHGDGRLALWCAAAPGIQATLIDEEPDRFFVPPYVGPRGWLGLRLDIDVDWAEVASIASDAFVQVAPARLRAELDGSRAP